MNKLEQVKAIKNGKGIQYLLNTAKMIFHNPLSTADMYYRLIALTDYIVDDSMWNELIATGSISMTGQEALAKKDFLEKIANADKSVIVRNDQMKHGRMVGYFFNRENIKAGLLAMYEYDTPFDDESRAAFELLASKITREIRNDEYFTTFGRAFHEDMIKRLLDGVIKDPSVYTPHVQVLYDGFEDYLHVAVVDVSRNDIQQNNLEYVKNSLMSKNQSYKYAIYSDYIVVIMSSKQRCSCYVPFFDQDNSLFEQNDIFVGIGNSFESLYELRVYYDQAVAAIKSGVESKSGQRVFTYNND